MACTQPIQLYSGGGTTTTPADSYTLKTICKCDDVFSDGSLIVNFVEAYRVRVTAASATSTKIGDFTDVSISSPYTVQGTVYNCNEIGTNASFGQGRLTLTGGSWSPTALMKSYSIRVSDVSGGEPTFTDSFGVPSTLALNEVLSYSDESLLNDAISSITVPALSEIIINYTIIK